MNFFWSEKLWNAGNIKYNQEERDGDGHAFLPLHDYLKLAEGAHAGEIAKLTKA